MTRRWTVVTGIMMAITVLLEIVFRPHGHVLFWWHRAPAVDLLFGGAGCVGIILVAKWLGHAWLERHEEYYENDAS
jgi:hypothetical protein